MRFLLIPILLLLNVAGCHKDIVPASTPDFGGHWKGTYTGNDDNGSWDFVIATNANITGTITSVVSGQTYQASGQVNAMGQVAVTIGSATSGAIFTGNLVGRNATGTWINNSRTPAFSGTWAGNKQ